MTFVQMWSRELVYIRRMTRGAGFPDQIRGRRAVAGFAAHAVADLAVFLAAFQAGLPAVGSHIASFIVATVVAWLVFQITRHTHERDNRSIGLSLVVALLALFLRGGVLALLMQVMGWTAQTAIILVALLSALLAVAGRWTQEHVGNTNLTKMQRWHMAAIVLILYSAALRLVYIAIPSLIPEEAYYWNYAQHLDWGYLDHPPMVAWIIKLGTLVFGKTEFGVRIGALVCWMATAGFGYAFAKELLGRRTAVGVVLLLASLPFFLGGGTLMMPDAPLTACWSGALFFLSRAVLRGRSGAWSGAGVCIGLGMLSKYTIGLLVPATFLYLLSDPSSRRWLARPQPYLAGLVAMLLFSPVVYWNATHHWASFVFQTSRRLNEVSIFSTHTLLGEIMLLLTPVAFCGAIAVLIARGRLGVRLTQMLDARRRRLFLLAFTLTPLAVVTAFSITHEPKLNWTGPTWLMALPFLAWVMLPSQFGTGGAFVSAVRKLWMPMVLVMLPLSGAVFHYLALGFPGVPYPNHTSDIAGWKDLQSQVAAIEKRYLAPEGRMLIAGFDRYNIASELAFYGAPDWPRKCASQHLFGEPGLMYEFWFPKPEQAGKSVIIVSRNRDWLDGPKIVPCFDSLSPITDMPVSLNGREIGKYYARVGFGYRIVTSNP